MARLTKAGCYTSLITAAKALHDAANSITLARERNIVEQHLNDAESQHDDGTSFDECVDTAIAFLEDAATAITDARCEVCGEPAIFMNKPKPGACCWSAACRQHAVEGHKYI